MCVQVVFCFFQTEGGIRDIGVTGVQTCALPIFQLRKLGDTAVIFTEVTLADHRTQDFARVENAIRAIDEVIECHLVSGGYDYMLKFLTRSIPHYQEIIEDLLARNNGIEKYFSYVVIKSVFVKRHYPLEKFFEV